MGRRVIGTQIQSAPELPLRALKITVVQEFQVSKSPISLAQSAIKVQGLACGLLGFRDDIFRVFNNVRCQKGIALSERQIGSNSVTQNVTYGVVVLYDQTRSVKSGATFPIQVSLTDYSGTDVLSAAIVLQAKQVTSVSGFSGLPESQAIPTPTAISVLIRPLAQRAGIRSMSARKD
jgi:hypothetical protein